MNNPTQKSSNRSEILKARKAHLIKLLTIIDPRPKKTTATQTLTINAINAKIKYIENKLPIKK